MATNTNININYKSTGEGKALKTMERVNKQLGGLEAGANKAGKESVSLTRSTTRLGQASASAGRQFGAQASGLGGLVSAYAGAAATVFALQQAFSALNRAAQAETILRGTQNLAAGIGESSSKILTSLQDITQGQLTLVEAAEKANLALASGFNTKQIEQLGEVSLKASKALGRNLGDAFERLVRGAAKLEPELLDELGIFTRIEPAAEKYAKQLGKTASELSQFERRQAFVNEVIDEGLRKFKAIDTTAPSAQKSIEQLSTTIVDLGTKFGIILANTLGPIADFFAKDMTNAVSLFSLALFQISRVAFRELGSTIDGVNTKIESFRARFLDGERASRRGKEAIDALNVTLMEQERTYYRGNAAAREQASTFTALGKEGNITASNLQKYIAVQREQLTLARAQTTSTRSEIKELVNKGLITQNLSKQILSLSTASKQEYVQTQANIKALAQQGVIAESTATRIQRLSVALRTAAVDEGVLTTRIEAASAAMAKQGIVAKTFAIATNGAALAITALGRAAGLLLRGLNVFLLATAFLPLLKQIPGVNTLIEKFTSLVTTSYKRMDRLKLAIRGMIASTDGIEEISKRYQALGQSAQASADAQEEVVAVLADITDKIDQAKNVGGVLSFFGVEESVQGVTSALSNMSGVVGALGAALAVTAVVATGLFSGPIAAGAAFIGGMTLAVTSLIDALTGFAITESIVGLFSGFFEEVDETTIKINSLAKEIDDYNKIAAKSDDIENALKARQVAESLTALRSALLTTTGAQVYFNGVFSEMSGLASDNVYNLIEYSDASKGLEASIMGVTIATAETKDEFKLLDPALKGLVVNFAGFADRIRIAKDELSDVNTPIKQIISNAQALSNSLSNLDNALDATNTQIAVQKELNKALNEEFIKTFKNGSEYTEGLRDQIKAGRDQVDALKLQVTAIQAVRDAREEETKALIEQGSQYEKFQSKLDELLKRYSSGIKAVNDFPLSGLFRDGAVAASEVEKLSNEFKAFEVELNKVLVTSKRFDLQELRKFFMSRGSLGADESLANYVNRINDATKAISEQDAVVRDWINKGDNYKSVVRELTELEASRNQLLGAITIKFLNQIPAINKLVETNQKFVKSLNEELRALKERNAIAIQQADLDVIQNRISLRKEEQNLFKTYQASLKESADISFENQKSALTNTNAQLEAGKKLIEQLQTQIDLESERRIGLIESRKTAFETLTDDVDFSFGISEEASDLLKQIISRDFEVQIQTEEIKSIDLKIANINEIDAVNAEQYQNQLKLIDLQENRDKYMLAQEFSMRQMELEEQSRAINERANLIKTEARIRESEIKAKKGEISFAIEQRRAQAEITAKQIQANIAFVQDFANLFEKQIKGNEVFLNAQNQVFQNFLRGLAQIFSESSGKAISAPSIGGVRYEGTDFGAIVDNLSKLGTEFKDITKPGGTLDQLKTEQLNSLNDIEKRRSQIDKDTENSLNTQLGYLKIIKSREEINYKSRLDQIQREAALQRGIADQNRDIQEFERDNAIRSLENQKELLQISKELSKTLQARDALGAVSALAGGVKSLLIGDRQEVITEAEEKYTEALDKHKEILAEVEDARQKEADALKKSVDILKERRTLELEIAGIFSEGIAGASEYFNLQKQYIDNLGLQGSAGSALKDARMEREAADRALIDSEIDLTNSSNRLKDAYADLDDVTGSLAFTIVDTIGKVTDLAVSLNSISGAEKGLGLGQAGVLTTAGKFFDDVLGMEKLGATLESLGALEQQQLSNTVGVPKTQEGGFFKELSTTLQESDNAFANTLGKGLDKVVGTLGFISKTLGYAFTGADFASRFNPDAKAGPTAVLGGLGGIGGGLIGAGLGAAAGGQIFGTTGALIAGPLGAALGAALGGIVGGTISKALFGKKSNKAGTGTIDFASGTVTEGGQTGNKYSAENRAAAMSIARFARDLNVAVEDLTGATTTLGRLEVGVGSRDPATLVSRFGREEFNPRDAARTGRQLFRLIIKGITPNVVNQDLKDAIANLDFGRELKENIARLEFASKFRDILKPFEALADGFLTIEEQLNAFDSSLFSQVKETADGIAKEIIKLLDRTKEVFGDNSTQVKELSDNMVNMLLANIDLNVAQDGRVRLLEKEASDLNTMSIVFAQIKTETAAFKDALISLGVSATEADRIIEEGVELRLRRIANEFDKSIDRALMLQKGIDVGVLGQYEEVLRYQNAIIEDAKTITKELGGYTDLVINAEEAVRLQRLQLISQSNDEQLRALRELTRAGGDFSNAFVKAAVDAEIASRKIAGIFEAAANLRSAERVSATLRRGFASGGIVEGGEPKKDSVPALLMPGEFVINEKAAKAIGYETLYGLNSGNFKKMQGGGQAGTLAPTTIEYGQGLTVNIPNNLLSDFASYGADTDLILSFQEAAAIVTDANTDLFREYRDLVGGATSVFSQEFDAVLSNLQDGEIIMARAIFELSTGLRQAADETEAYNQVISESRTNQLLNIAGIIKGIDEVGGLTESLNDFYFATQTSQTQYLDLYKVTNELNKLLAQEVITSDEYASALNSVNAAYDESIRAIQEYTSFFVDLQDSLDFTGAQANVRSLIYYFEDATNTIRYAVEDGFIDTVESAKRQIQLQEVYNQRRIELIKDANEEQLKAIRDSQDSVVDITYKTGAAAELLARQLQAASKSFGSFEGELVDFYNSILPAGEKLYNGLKRSLESILNEADVVFAEVSTDFIGTIGVFTVLAQQGKAGIGNLQEAIEQLNHQLTVAESIDIETYQTGISLLSSSFNEFINEFQELRNALEQAEDNMEAFRRSLLSSTESIASDIKSLFSQMVSDYRSGLQNLQNMYTQALQGQANAEEQLYNTLFSAQQAFATAGGDLEGHISIIKGIIEGPDGYGGLSTYLESLRLDIENGIASIAQIDTQSSIEELQEQLQNRLDRLTALQTLPDSADKFVRISRILSEITDIESQLNSATNASNALKNAALDLVDVELELNKNNLDAKYTDVNLTLTELANNLVTQAQEARAAFNEANDVVAGITQALANADASGFILALEGLDTSSDTVAEFNAQLSALQTEFINIQEAATLISNAGFSEVLNDFINIADPNRIAPITQAAEQAFEELKDTIAEYSNILDAKNAYEALYGSIESTTTVLPIDEFNALNNELQSLKDKITTFLPTIGATSLDDLDSAFKQFIEDAIALLASPITLDVTALVNTATLQNQTIQGQDSLATTLVGAGTNSITNSLLQSILTQGLGAASPGWLYYILIVAEQIRDILNVHTTLLGGTAQVLDKIEIKTPTVEDLNLAPVQGGGNLGGGGGGLTGQFFSVEDPISMPADYFYIVTPKFISASEIFIFTEIPITDVVKFMPTTLFGLDQAGQPGAFILEASNITWEDLFTIELATKTFDDFIEISLVDHDWTNWWNPAILQDHTWREWWNDATLQDHNWSKWWNPATLLDHDVYSWFFPNEMASHDVYTWFNPITQIDTTVNDWFSIDKISVGAYDFFDVNTPVQLSDYVEQKSIDYTTFFNVLVQEKTFRDFFELNKIGMTLLDWITIDTYSTKLSDWTTIELETIKLNPEDLFDIDVITLYASDLYDIQAQSLPASSFYTVDAQRLAAGNFFTIDTDDKIQLTLADIVVSDPLVADPAALKLSDMFTNYDSGFTFPKYALGVGDIIDVVALNQNGLEDKHTLTLADIFSNVTGGATLNLDEKADVNFDSFFNPIERRDITSEQLIDLDMSEKISRSPSQVFDLTAVKIPLKSDQLIEISKQLKPAEELFTLVTATIAAEDVIDFSYLSDNKYQANAEDVMSIVGTLSSQAKDVFSVTGTKNIDANVILELTKSDVSGNQLFAPQASDISGNVFWKVKQSEITGSALFALAPNPKIGVTAYDLFEITKEVPLDVSGTFESDLAYVGDEISALKQSNETNFGSIKDVLGTINTSVSAVAKNMLDTFFSYYQDTFLKSYFDQWTTDLKTIQKATLDIVTVLSDIYETLNTDFATIISHLSNIEDYAYSIDQTVAEQLTVLKDVYSVLETIDQDTSKMTPDIEEIRKDADHIATKIDVLDTISATLERIEDLAETRNEKLVNIEISTANLVGINKVRYVYDNYFTRNVPGYATGGEVRGAGTGTSDSIPAKLSNGEFVINASSAKQIGMPILNALNTTGDVGYLGNFGRNGDNMLAHITGSEANMLMMMGGSGTVNPMTGLREFFFDGFNPNVNTYKKYTEDAIRLFRQSWNYGDGYPEWMTARGENQASYYNNTKAKQAMSLAVRAANIQKYGTNTYNLRNKNWIIDWDNWGGGGVNTWNAPWGSSKFRYDDGKRMVDTIVNSFANGGAVSGPGTSTSDSIMAMLSDGEYVLRKSAVDKVGVNTLDYMNSTGNTPGNVEINITNNGQPVDVEGQPNVTMRDGKVVVDVVLKDLRTNGPIARSVKKMR